MIPNTLKLFFFGSSNYCLPILAGLRKNFNLISVITRPNSVIKKFTSSHNIKTHTPASKEELLHLRSQLSQLLPDLAIVADYGLIIPRQIYEIPKFKTLNIHFSKLPKYRGPSPVQYTILYGEKSAWITIFILEEKMDTGDIIWKKEVPLNGNETTESLYKKLFKITAAEQTSVITDYVSNKLTPIKQNHSKATYTKLLTREDGFLPYDLLKATLQGKESSLLLNWKIRKLFHSVAPAAAIERALRAFTPWPGLWTEITLRHLGGSRFTLSEVEGDSPEVEKSKKRNMKRLKILKAHLEGNKLILDQVQLEGKKPVSWKQFKEGYSEIMKCKFYAISAIIHS